MVVQSGIKYYVSGKKWETYFHRAIVLNCDNENRNADVIIGEIIICEYTNEEKTRIDANKEKSHVSIRNHS